LVAKNLSKPGQYTSIYPLESHEDWLHNAVQIKRLAKLADRVAELEQKLKKMEDQS
jgi:UDP-3-O-[3-hydroxymyristoyl] glucosamine N-acyltransferase